VVVRVQATPEVPDEGSKLADEIMLALSTVTGDHETADSNSRLSGSAPDGGACPLMGLGSGPRRLRRSGRAAAVPGVHLGRDASRAQLAAHPAGGPRGH
jgi:hypothetical protein